jgi:hypothetical protein
MNAYEIGMQLALEDLGLEKLAQGFQSIEQMKNQAYARQRQQSGNYGGGRSASMPSARPAAQRPATPQMRTPVTAQQVPGVTSRSGGVSTSRALGAAPPSKAPPGRLNVPGRGMARQAQTAAQGRNERLRRALAGAF